jgi:cysteine desulfurase
MEMERRETGPRLYLDFNATAPLRPSARAAMLAALDLVGNASSVHADGRAARALVERAREAVAALLGASAENVVFTSGATEAANLALTPELGFEDKRADYLLVAAIEHACVLHGHRFSARQVVRLPVDGNGCLDLSALEHWLARHPERVMLALQAANNETGVLQPVAEAAARVHAHGGMVVCDAVQAIGKIACSFTTTGADAVLISAHKFGGPKGAGALVFANDRWHLNAPLLRGGGQERGARAGTENVAALAGFGAAADAIGDVDERLSRWRDQVEEDLVDFDPAAVIFARSMPRLPNTSAFALPSIRADTLLIALDLAGISVSSGSACSSGKVRRSHVLDAMGVDPTLASGAIRVSFGPGSQAGDAARFSETLRRLVGKMRGRKWPSAA